MEQKTCNKCGSTYFLTCFSCYENAIKDLKKRLGVRDTIAAAIDREFQNLPRYVVERNL